MFFFVLTSLARSSFNIGLFDRPLVAAMLMGICTGNLEFALSLGIIFELFWLDILRLGAVIPPSGTLSFLLLYSFTLIFNWFEPTNLAIPILLCLPLAYTVAWLELLQRKHANSYISFVEKWIENPVEGKNPHKIIIKSLCRFICLYALLYLGLFFALYKAFQILISSKALVEIPTINWAVLYIISLLGAVLALRIKRAYLLLLFCVLAIFAWNF